MKKNTPADIELVLLDVDGVLTDGKITYSDSGEQIKSFDSKDGLGIRLLMKSGIQVGIITARKSKALEHRCKNLKIDLLLDGIRDKAKGLEQMTRITGIKPEKTAYVGDDLLDLPIMKRVGLPICVADACKDVKKHSQMITVNKGGSGAVREIAETILQAKGVWEDLLAQYLS